MNSPEDTIVAIATPVGESALGVLRLSGVGAITIADKIFKPASQIPLKDIPPQQAVFGQIIGERALDQVVATAFHAPRSYTGEHLVELSTHGNPQILQEIVQLCIRHGARHADPGEFTLRAFLAGKMDLTLARSAERDSLL